MPSTASFKKAIAPRDLRPGLNLRERGELIVDNHDAVVADRDADVAARSLKHVDRSRDFLDFDLDLAEILLLCKRRGRDETEEGHNHSSHGGKL